MRRAEPLPARGRHDADGQDLGRVGDHQHAGPAEQLAVVAFDRDVVPVRAIGELGAVAARRPRLGAEHLALVGHQQVDVRATSSGRPSLAHLLAALRARLDRVGTAQVQRRQRVGRRAARRSGRGRDRRARSVDG